MDDNTVYVGLDLVSKPRNNPQAAFLVCSGTPSPAIRHLIDSCYAYTPLQCGDVAKDLDFMTEADVPALGHLHAAYALVNMMQMARNTESVQGLMLRTKRCRPKIFAAVGGLEMVRLMETIPTQGGSITPARVTSNGLMSQLFRKRHFLAAVNGAVATTDNILDGTREADQIRATTKSAVDFTSGPLCAGNMVPLMDEGEQSPSCVLLTDMDAISVARTIQKLRPQLPR